MWTLWAIAVTAAAQSYTVTGESPHWDLEIYYHDHRFEEGLAEANIQLAANPNDADLYFHVVRFMFDVAEVWDRTDKTIDRRGYYEHMVELCDRGLAIDPHHSNLRFSRGAALGRVATTRGVLASMSLVKPILDTWLSVAAEDHRYRSIGGEHHMPCDAFLGLGVALRLLPDSWFVQVFTGIRGDLTSSLDWLTKADQCEANRIAVVKELGVTQLCYGKKRKDPASTVAGQATLNRLAKLTPRHEKERIDLAHGTMILENPNLACGYSRDKQQDTEAKRSKAEP